MRFWARRKWRGLCVGEGAWGVFIGGGMCVPSEGGRTKNKPLGSVDNVNF